MLEHWRPACSVQVGCGRAVQRLWVGRTSGSSKSVPYGTWMRRERRETDVGAGNAVLAKTVGGDDGQEKPKLSSSSTLHVGQDASALLAVRRPSQLPRILTHTVIINPLGHARYRARGAGAVKRTWYFPSTPEPRRTMSRFSCSISSDILSSRPAMSVVGGRGAGTKGGGSRTAGYRAWES